MDLTSRNYHDHWIEVCVQSGNSVFDESIMGASEAEELSAQMIATASELTEWAILQRKKSVEDAGSLRP